MRGIPKKVAERRRNSPCWEWPGQRLPTGYGMKQNKKAVGIKNFLVHRLVYAAIFGEIPKGLVIDHLCRNTCCCNPFHLEPVTYQENFLRGESPFVKFAQQTHCKWGHEYTPENTRYRKGRFARICKMCSAEYSKKRCREGHFKKDSPRNRDKPRTRKCPHCQEMYPPMSKHQKFCSIKCSIQDKADRGLINKAKDPVTGRFISPKPSKL